MAHKPTPWHIETRDDGDRIVRSSDHETVHWDTTYYPSGLDDDDAAFIVRAVNAHDDLVAALKQAIATHGSEYSWGKAARAALAKAEGK